jgi:hypothetical protein
MVKMMVRHPKVWSLQEAAFWIETRTLPLQRIRQIGTATLQELHRELRAGTLAASGCVDGSERRTVSPEEWNDYRLHLKHVMFPNHHYMGSSGTPVIEVLSIRSFPAAALKDHAHPSGVRLPSARSRDGEPGYHRAITDVLLRREEVVQKWPEIGRTMPANGELNERPARRLPSRERARNTLSALYPDGVPDQAAKPNAVLCREVGDKLKAAGLHPVSDDTILRAAGRRR